MMVQIRPKRFFLGTVKKLHACSAEPFKILNKLNDNTYVIDFHKDFGINSIFNVKDLVYFKGLKFNSSNSLVEEPSPELFSESLLLPPLSDIHSNIAEKVDRILDDEIIWKYT